MGNNNDNNNNYPFSTPEGEGDASVQLVPKIDTPKMYKVILLNDDYTPMDFVVLVLRRFFAKTEEQATEIMLDVHKKGAGVAGVFSLEIAEMKVMQVNQFAQLNQFPLKSTLEEDT
ncbi:ATP-dependent Clp protease adapter ClpS [Bdellovibrio sp. HCB2-146]|uniref:ATP-dependent Clp protease adapter ClpS n=1 Tax=Bdellovibrio sp. HCB2-146 TaxID=3394362 RepID=UPI0039BC3799